MGAVGLDMGVKHFITTSDGIPIEPLNALKKREKQLKREHRRLSRKERGSENRKKQIGKLERPYQEIRDARRDFNHKVSSAIAKHYGTVVIEDLNVGGMAQNHKLAKKRIGPGLVPVQGDARIQVSVERRRADKDREVRPILKDVFKMWKHKTRPQAFR